GGVFDRFLLIPFGTLAGLSGLILFPVFGYSIVHQWVWLSTILYLGVIGLGMTVWRTRGVQVEAAIAADDDAAAVALLRDPRYVALSRGENVVVFIVVVLMIARPS